MQFTIQVEGHLRQYFPQYGKPVALTLPGTPTVADCLAAAKIPAELPSAVLAGRVRTELAEPVPEGAELIVLSPMAGG